MATEEDIWIEADGKIVYFLSKVTPDADESGPSTVTIPEMSVVHRAMVQSRSAYTAQVASGGISGNVIAIEWYDPSSGQITSGLSVSGSMLDVIVAGK